MECSLWNQSNSSKHVVAGKSPLSYKEPFFVTRNLKISNEDLFLFKS